MRALLPVVFVAGFGLFIRYVWADVLDAITRVRDGGPGLTAPPPAPPRPPVNEPVEDNRVFEPGEVLPPPARPRGRTQYADPHTPPPPNRVHPAERVMQVP